ncbi:MAG TPA: N-acetylmuramoyl-L-alanine amidase [Candidatus Acidoferrales bacterium]|nr:N-acetylmuramoyl-L-alanine amidase [Candidatus Acidoferrales bacterium]
MEKFLADISDILRCVRRALSFGCIILLAEVCLVAAAQNPQRTQDPPQSQQQIPEKPATPTPPSQQTTPPQAPPPTSAPTQPAAMQQAATPITQALQVVVIDPAHGGSDSGARGVNGVTEKDIVLEFARETSAALRTEGFQVVLTRQGDGNPSADERATIANEQNNAIFISLHVASTGPINTVRTYAYLFPAPVAPAVASSESSQRINAATPIAALPGFLLWQEAQRPFVGQSRKLGDLLQVELAQKFKGSPEVAWSAPVFGLRSVAAPAVAVEVSSVAANPQQLEAMAAPLAQGIARAVTAYKTIYPPGGR